MLLGDQLVSDVIQIASHDSRLRPNFQEIIAWPFDQRSTPTGSNRAQRVPCVTGNETQL